MRDRKHILENLLIEWDTLKELDSPPSEAKKLLAEGECVVYVEDTWGPAVPYPPIRHSNGELNHGYRRVKSDLEAINAIPEVQDFPEYRDFLKSINSADSVIESVGCEKSFFPINNHPAIKAQLGSYTDIVFSDHALNNNPRNVLYLASVFVESLKGSSDWWSSAELGIQRLRGLYEQPKPWGLMLRVQGYGHTREEARACWAISLNKLAASVATIRLDEMYRTNSTQ